MPPLSTLSHLVFIIRKCEVEGFYPTKKYFMEYFENETKIPISPRTFDRYKEYISTIFGKDIEYDSQHGGYHIYGNGLYGKQGDALVSWLDVFQSIQLANHFEKYVYSDQRAEQYLDKRKALVNAMAEGQCVHFNFQEWGDDEARMRWGHPYLLREFKNRWYLVMCEPDSDHEISRFALDRMTDLVVMNETFVYPKDFNAADFYGNCYGIINPNLHRNKNETLEEVVISFYEDHRKFIKSMPLHHSQKILIDNEEELRIQVKLYLTYDFIKELLSYTEGLKVISPPRLVEIMKESFRLGLENY